MQLSVPFCNAWSMRFNANAFSTFALSLSFGSRRRLMREKLAFLQKSLFYFWRNVSVMMHEARSLEPQQGAVEARKRDAVCFGGRWLAKEMGEGIRDKPAAARLTRSTNNGTSMAKKSSAELKSLFDEDWGAVVKSIAEQANFLWQCDRSVILVEDPVTRELHKAEEGGVLSETAIGWARCVCVCVCVCVWVGALQCVEHCVSDILASKSALSNKCPFPSCFLY